MRQQLAAAGPLCGQALTVSRQRSPCSCRSRPSSSSTSSGCTARGVADADRPARVRSSGAFGVFSLLAAAIFLWHGVIRRKLLFRFNRDPCSIRGAVSVLFALALYPAWLSLSGHRYPAFPSFGLPCPITLFTVGMLGLALLISASRLQRAGELRRWVADASARSPPRRA